MRDLIVSVSDHCLSFYFESRPHTLIQTILIEIAFPGVAYVCSFKMAVLADKESEKY